MRWISGSPAHKSVYSPSLRSIYQRHAYTLEDGRSFPVTPFYRTPLYYGTACEGPVTAVDRIKSYTSLLMELDKVPVFTEFCEFEPLVYERPWIQLRQVSDEPAHYAASDTLSQCSDPTDIPSHPQAPVDLVKDPLQPSAEEALAQLEYAAAGGSWRTYMDKNLVDIVLSLRQQKRSEEDVLRFLTVDLEQPQGRASNLIKRAAHAHPSERERHSLYFVMRVADDLVKGDNPAHLAITFHRLLGLLAHGEEAEEDMDEEGNVKVRGHDISGVTHICFDEVYCYNPLMLGQLKRWLAKNATMADGTERHFYAAGDANQNPPIYASCLNRLHARHQHHLPQPDPPQGVQARGRRAAAACI